MMGQERCREVLGRVLYLSEAEETEAYLSVQDMFLTRYANNVIHQNVAHRNAQLHLRAVVGRRQGRAVTNVLTDLGIAEAVEHAHHNALLMPEDPDFNGLPRPEVPGPLHVYDEATDLSSPETRARAVAVVCARAGEAGLEASGAYRTGTQESAVMSSRGADAYHAGTFAGLIVTAMSPTSAGWAKGGSWRASDIDVESLAQEAMDKATRGRDPRPVEPGDYAVVLDPYAVDDMLGSLSLYGMGAQLVQEGRSWMNDTMGQCAMSPMVSIWDDGRDVQGWPAPFDCEGVPSRRVDVVREGVVGQPVHNSYTAAKEGQASTGHQAYFTGGPMATSLFMAPGDATLEDMIASTPRGLYITRFHYTRLAHTRGCVMTGMTRDGVFMIDGGQVGPPVKNLRFTQSYVDALASAEDVGSQRRLILNEAGFSTLVPALKLGSFSFTGVTV